jgi:hypothetical protein
MADLYIAVYRRASRKGWPYDLGDDPAFESSERRDAAGRIVRVDRVTWGVCRPNVRNPIQPDDLVVFLSADRNPPFRYQFVGFAVVERKVTRDTIWAWEGLAPYRTYRNLLVRRERGGFRHVEAPHFGERVWHGDWLSRILDRNQRGNVDFVALQNANFVSYNARILGQPVRFAENYVLFRPEGSGTFIAANPPTVAVAAVSGATEVWKDDPFSRALRQVLLDGRKRTIRSTHKQIAHPHIRLRNVDTAAIQRQLHALCRQFSVKPRVGSILGRKVPAVQPRKGRVSC